MRILLAVDGSDYTKRMISYLGAHRDAWVSGHSFTVFYVVIPVPHRAAAFAGPDLVHGYWQSRAFRPRLCTRWAIRPTRSRRTPNRASSTS